MSATVTSILDQVLGPITDSLTRESAERILQFQLDPETKARMDALAGKANEGSLSDSELAEYAEYVEAMDWVGILKAKARDAVAREAR